MKKAVVLASLLVLVGGWASAQEVRKGFIGIGFGPSIPVGDFGVNAKTNDKAAYAKTGINLELNLGYKFSEVVGAMLLIRGQGHQVDAEKYGNQAVAALPAGSSYTFESDSYGTGSFLIGPFLSFPLTGANKLALEARGLVGYSSTSTPEIKFSSNSFGGSQRMQSKTGSSFAWMVGAGLGFQLSGRLGLGVHLDYFSSNPEFDWQGYKINQSVNLINTTFSIGYRFN